MEAPGSEQVGPKDYYSFKRPKGQHVEMCREAWEVSDEEKVRVKQSCGSPLCRDDR